MITSYRYDIYSSSNAIIRFLGKRLLGVISQKLININARSLHGLDIGCAYGDMLSYLCTNDIIGEMVSIDIDKNRVCIAKDKVSQPEYIVADTLSLCLRDDSFDFILCSEVFEHLINPYDAMNEIIRVAKSNSFLIVSVPYEPYFHWGNILRGRHLSRWGKTPSHVSFWDRNDFRIFLKSFRHIAILEENSISTFPWLVFLCNISK
jgi:ubiquinone/menaquinone biosynthesis C-methylase UbiE